MRVDEIYTNDFYRDEPLSLAAGYMKDRTVVISGGGSGMGRATAWQAARLGARVVICTRNVEKLEVLTKAITEAGFLCEHAALDIRDRDQVEPFMNGVFDRYGNVDLLVNSAGGQFSQLAVDYTEKGWRSVIDTNLTGTFNMMQAGARRWMGDDLKGSIVSITFSPRGVYQMAHALAARAGMTGFSEAVAAEWAPNVRVNCIAPGAILSDHHLWEFVERRMKAGNVMLSVGTAWEVASAVLFIGGPAAPFTTGQTLHINGGANVWGETWPLGKPERLQAASAASDPEDDKRDQEWAAGLLRGAAAPKTA